MAFDGLDQLLFGIGGQDCPAVKDGGGLYHVLMVLYSKFWAVLLQFVVGVQERWVELPVIDI